MLVASDRRSILPSVPGVKPPAVCTSAADDAGLEEVDVLRQLLHPLHRGFWCMHSFDRFSSVGIGVGQLHLDLKFARPLAHGVFDLFQSSVKGKTAINVSTSYASPLTAASSKARSVVPSLYRCSHCSRLFFSSASFFS